MLGSTLHIVNLSSATICVKTHLGVILHVYVCVFIRMVKKTEREDLSLGLCDRASPVQSV